ncbi:penicillin-binding protein 2 [uncultured Helcococcus sp.]|uniref:peptidoglycan D,D-transpeptidase FtsI family protein n=2 Tax=uncultured Helcococcus sp. TaxID=1072508 RepID=UPI002623E27F|nr:penicillin-binding protein 2 [uncultured Helcococcus sp.]
MKDKRNKKLVVVLAIVTALFLAISLYLLYFQIFKADKLNKDPRNARNFEDNAYAERGKILDKNGKLLAYSEKNEDGKTYTRKYSYNYLYSNITGYSDPNLGKIGIEASLNRELANVSKKEDLFTRIDSLVSETNASDVYLTIENDIQEYAWEALGNYTGSVIVADPKTGAILAMVSKPTFNVNTLRADWENIIASEDGRLLNRPGQGLYEPGSVFKTVSSITFLRAGIDLSYNDKGTATIADHTINNYAKRAHGEISLREALMYSSNTYFYEKSREVSNEDYIKVLKDFGIGEDYEFSLPLKSSIFPFKSGLSDLEKANAAFGQGQTLMTPMDMLLITMGIANDGIVYRPYIVDKIDRNGIVKQNEDNILSDRIESEYAKTVREYLTATAEYNGFTLKSGIYSAGKTGTGQTSDGLNNNWYINMAPADDPKYVVVVTIEGSQQTAFSTAGPIASRVLNYVINR